MIPRPFTHSSVLFLLFASVLTLPIYDLRAQVDVQKIKERQRERHRDFYFRLLDEERREAKKNEGIGELKKERAERARRQEVARQEFMRKRKDRPPRDDSEHLKKLEARREAHQAALKEYLTKRERVREASKSYQIPEEHEFRIFPEDHLL